MNPFSSVPYSFPYPMYYQPMYHQNQSYFSYYPGGFPPYHFRSQDVQNQTTALHPFPKKVIKIEDDSDQDEERGGARSKQKKQASKKNPKKKRRAQIVPKPIKTYIEYPPKLVSYRARYFDPSSSPLITTNSYNLVECVEKEQNRALEIQALPQDLVNQLNFPETGFENPFIVFKYRRIKKKFKKYVKSKDEFARNIKAENSEFINVISDLSQDDEDSSESPLGDKTQNLRSLQCKNTEYNPKSEIQSFDSRKQQDSQSFLFGD